MKKGDLRNIFKKTFNRVCTSTVVVSPEPLVFSSINFLSYETPENTEEDPEAAYEGDIQIEESLISCTAQVQKFKNYLEYMRSAQVLFDNPKYLTIQHLSNPVVAGLMESDCTWKGNHRCACPQNIHARGMSIAQRCVQTYIS